MVGVEPLASTIPNAVRIFRKKTGRQVTDFQLAAPRAERRRIDVFPRWPKPIRFEPAGRPAPPQSGIAPTTREAPLVGKPYLVVLLRSLLCMRTGMLAE